MSERDDRNGDDDTPAQGTRIWFSAEALNLLDLALAYQSVAVNLREAARSLDSTKGPARESLRAQLEQRLAEIGRLSLEASAALKEGL
jgi:hypothetical protein